MNATQGAAVRFRRIPPTTLGPLLNSARLRQGLSYRAAARAAGVSLGLVYDLTHGRCCPSLVVAHRIADALGLDDDERQQLLAAAVTDAGRSHPARATA